ncbi:unknown [Clostridium sp. CAG:762]|nr:unknown [Clostridium sp. CAG:762]
MIRTETDEDITDEEYIKVLKPFVDNYDEYLESYVLPELISNYIANA